jgi:hypothetical protein
MEGRGRCGIDPSGPDPSRNLATAAKHRGQSRATAIASRTAENHYLAAAMNERVPSPPARATRLSAESVIEWPVVEFLRQFRVDQAAGQVRPLRDYLARHPEHETAIAREYLLVQSLDARPDPTSEPERVGPFELRRELGTGGEGTVWLAHDPLLGRDVALKVLTAARGDLDEARVRRAATMAARLDHPAIVRVLGAGRHERTTWVASGFVDGHSLAVELERRRAGGAPFTAREVGTLLAPIARALQHAHERGVVHRDVKPGNLLLARDGGLVLGDFGMARDDDPANDLTIAGEVHGTPAYMAPEQLLHGARTPAIDVWALGVVGCELATLVPPFKAVTSAAIAERVVREPAWTLPGWARLERDLQAVLALALAKDPRQRYASAAAFAEDLERLAVGVPVRARSPGFWRRTKAWAAAHPVVATGGAATLLALVAGLLLTLQFLWREQHLRTRAEASAARTWQVATAILFDRSLAVDFESGGAASRARLVQQAVDALRELAALEPGNQRLQRELCIAWLRLAEVRANGSEPSESDERGAAKCLDAAEAIARDALVGDPRQDVLLATAELRRADLAAGDRPRAAAGYRRAFASVPGTDRERRAVRGTAQAMLAQFARDEGDLVTARTAIAAALAEFAADPDDAESRNSWLIATSTAATIQAQGGDAAAAAQSLRDGLDQLPPPAAATTAQLRIRAEFERLLATCLLMQEHDDEGRALFATAVQRCRDLCARDVTDRGATRRLVQSLRCRAETLRRMGDVDAATVDDHEADAVAARLVATAAPAGESAAAR